MRLGKEKRTVKSHSRQLGGEPSQSSLTEPGLCTGCQLSPLCFCCVLPSLTRKECSPIRDSNESSPRKRMLMHHEHKVNGSHVRPIRRIVHLRSRRRCGVHCLAVRSIRRRHQGLSLSLSRLHGLQLLRWRRLPRISAACGVLMRRLARSAIHTNLQICTGDEIHGHSEVVPVCAVSGEMEGGRERKKRERDRKRARERERRSVRVQALS